MSDSIRIGQLYPAGGPALTHKSASKASAPENGKTIPFQTMLKASELKFSHHAEVRMQQRGIRLKPEQLSEIVTAIEQAAGKGAKDSLVLYRDIAMIVNVPTKTVVTAMDGNTANGNVFTQIDSAVVIT